MSSVYGAGGFPGFCDEWNFPSLPPYKGKSAETGGAASAADETKLVVTRRDPVSKEDEPAFVEAGKAKLAASRRYSFTDEERLSKIQSKFKILELDEDPDIVYLFTRATRAAVLEEAEKKRPVYSHNYSSSGYMKQKCGHPSAAIVYPTGRGSECGWCSDLLAQDKIIEELTEKMTDMLDFIEDSPERNKFIEDAERLGVGIEADDICAAGDMPPVTAAELDAYYERF